MGHITAIHIAPKHQSPMQACQTARIIADMGIEGDRHARQGRNGQVLIMPEEVLDRLDLLPGVVRENITTRGVDVMALQPGDRVTIGEAVLEVTRPAHPCELMDDIRPGLRDELEGQRGMLFRVLEGGTVRVGDAVEMPLKVQQ